MKNIQLSEKEFLTVCTLTALLEYFVIYYSVYGCTHIQYENTQLRQALSVKKRVAITLWALASSEYRIVAHLFVLDDPLSV